jgi:hypothetical protein
VTTFELCILRTDSPWVVTALMKWRFVLITLTDALACPPLVFRRFNFLNEINTKLSWAYYQEWRRRQRDLKLQGLPYADPCQPSDENREKT